MQSTLPTPAVSFYKATFIIFICLFTKLASVYSQLTVAHSVTVQRTSQSGEIQSTVVPPSDKYPKGCVLITQDRIHPPTKGAVLKFDPDKPGTVTESKFDNVPNSFDYTFGTNDHDILTLPNRDVLYITGAFSKRPLTPKPAWFDSTYRDNFGPGARYVVLTWRSTDAGDNFSFLSEFDPSNLENGIPSFPQFRRDSIGVAIEKPRWDMGGADGQYSKLVPGTDIINMTYGIVGYNQKSGTGNKFSLDVNNKINKTMLVSSTGGTNWTYQGMVDQMYWRGDMVQLREKPGAPIYISGVFGNGAIVTGKKTGNQKYQFESAKSSGKDYRDTWRVSGPLNPYIYTNVSANTVMGRVKGGSQLVIVYPGAAQFSNVCRMFFFNTETGEFNEADMIVPEDKSAGGFIMHPTIIDPGNKGPLLIYWYDLNSKTSHAKIKGRIITGEGAYTGDFLISKFGSPRSELQASFFSVDGSNNYWYGDYHTAGAYTTGRRLVQERGSTASTTHFFPVWVQPGNKISYGEVVFNWTSDKKLARIPFGEEQLLMREIPPRNWTKPLTVDLKKVAPIKDMRIENRKELRQRQ